MDDRLIFYCRQRRQRRQQYKEAVAKGCYSVMLVIVALVALRPLMVDQILSRAAAYGVVGQLDESQRECDKALLLDDDSGHAWQQLACIYRSRGDRAAAYDAYEKAVQADCANRPASFELGMMYADDGRYQLAIPYFEQVRRLGTDQTADGQIRADSYHRAALHMLVYCYEKVGDLVEREMALKEIRVFYPGYGGPEDLRVSLPDSDPAR